ncbi:MAG: hypothetical protein KJ804_14530 [Proteobacteria bacterium]|nr:hypothetical protein [Pseudomonadota bacterium]MBU1059525.1 hypothetical protein [Pseudomonadota bacterium]
MRYNHTFFSLLLVTLLVTSCSANKLLFSWTDKSLDQYRLRKILVIGVAKDETKRRIYEDTFVSSLTKIEVPAVPSYTVSKEAIKPSTEGLQEIIKRSEAGAVLITHLVGKNEEDALPPSLGLNAINTRFPYGLYGYYPVIYHAVYSIGNYSDNTKVVLETNLYDVRTEKLIWSARSQSIDPVMTRKYYQQLINLFLSDLEKQNIIFP